MFAVIISSSLDVNRVVEIKAHDDRQEQQKNWNCKNSWNVQVNRDGKIHQINEFLRSFNPLMKLAHPI